MINRVREETIKNIFNKYETEPSHAKQVKKLALIIFDKTRGIIHEMSNNERDLLQAGALLHDIGYFICADGHNKNSYKIIQKEPFLGFSDKEKDIIANITRYHRGKLPRARHSCYANLSDDSKKLVNKLGGFARLADGLDRTHCSVVNDLEFEFDPSSRKLIIFLKPEIPNCFFEIKKSEDKKDMLEKAFDLKISFKIA